MIDFAFTFFARSTELESQKREGGPLTPFWGLTHDKDNTMKCLVFTSLINT